MGLRTICLIAGAALMFASGSTGARAATVFFYSATDDYYGWAAGYNYGRAESVAHDNCSSSARDCKFALECDGGWSAAAYADGFAKAVSFSCGYNKPIGARIAAITACVAQAKTLCWTSSTISNRGDERSDEDNRAFDMAWYAQEMLYVLDFDPGAADGQLGGKTRAVLKDFQTKLGLEPTGKLDDELFRRLLDAVGGRQAVTKGLKEGIVDPRADEYAKTTYVLVTTQSDGATFSQEIARRSDDDRRVTLATLLSIWGTACTLPAKSAQPVPDDGSGGWLVTCDQGEWTVMMGEGMHTVASGLRTITVEGDSVIIGSPAEEGGGGAGEGGGAADERPPQGDNSSTPPPDIHSGRPLPASGTTQ